MTMISDIEARIAADFSEAERDEALNLLILLDNELSDGGHPRILRCVLLLAQGNLARLVHFADRARQDWRDVIYWAEYDEQDRRIRDLNRPFTES